jgi:hypothetical protein
MRPPYPEITAGSRPGCGQCGSETPGDRRAGRRRACLRAEPRRAHDELSTDVVPELRHDAAFAELALVIRRWVPPRPETADRTPPRRIVLLRGRVLDLEPVM